MISKKLAKWIAYHPKTVLIVCLILIIPSIIGYFLTGVNYDILSYLPENLESVQGEQILDETFHNSASSFIIVKDTEPRISRSSKIRSARSRASAMLSAPLISRM